MNFERRTFLKLTAVLGAGIVASPITNTLLGCTTAAKLNVQNNFGLGLYTLRDELPKDPKGVLTKVASFGYKEIESYEHDKLGMFWGMSAVEFKKLMDDLGMKIVSSHCAIHKDLEKKADEAAAIGMRYLVCPSLDGPMGKSEDKMNLDDYKRAADLLNKAGEICKSKGLRFGYHNHDHTFIPRNGVIPQDILIQNTDQNTVDYEMDIYWVVTGGQDPEAWFRKYPGRFKLSHVKDRKKGIPASEREASVNLGTGSIDFSAILRTGIANGMTHFFVEQERYEGTTPLDAVKTNANYMKNFRSA